MKFAAIVALPAEMPRELWPFEEPLIYSGVGKINAAFTTTQVIQDYKPDLIINFGTAGSLKDSIGGLVEVNKVVQRDFNAEPLAPRGSVPFDEFPNELFSGFGNVVCGTGDTFVRTKESWLKSNGVDLVDMELFAIAKVCEHLITPWRSFKFITDYVNTSSETDWEVNLIQAPNSFIEVIMERLD